MAVRPHGLMLCQFSSRHCKQQLRSRCPVTDLLGVSVYQIGLACSFWLGKAGLLLFGGSKCLNWGVWSLISLASCILLKALGTFRVMSSSCCCYCCLHGLIGFHSCSLEFGLCPIELCTRQLYSTSHSLSDCPPGMSVPDLFWVLAQPAWPT